VQLVNASLAGDLPKASKLHRKLYPIFKTLFIEPNPVPVKYALARAGIIKSALVREPLSELTKVSEQTLVSVLKTLGK
jgi:4-hydroxy-tetrahydrodipicolinate synthase